MQKKIYKFLASTILIVIFIFSLNFIFKNEWSRMYATYFPCKKPILYSLGSLDPRFNISESNFLEALKEAEKIWEQPIGKDLFSYKPTKSDGNLKINLVYDYRQEATTKIKTLGLIVEDTRHSYDQLQAKYKSIQSEYLKAKSEYQSRSSLFVARQDKYTKSVDYWNSKGGAPENIYKELNTELSYLKKEFDALQILENNLNKKVNDINALVTVINRLAKTLNLNTSEINTLGKTQGEEFTQGDYKGDANSQEINVYEFSTKEKLVRLLAHEFGHALGIGHVEAKEAIMNRLNESKNQKLAPDDISALKLHCKLD